MVVDIEATKKIIKKHFKFFDDDDDDNDDEDNYSHFRVFCHNSSKNNFLGLKPKNELFLSKNLLNKFFSRMKLKFQKKNSIFFFNFFLSKYFLIFFFLEIKKNLKRYFYDGAHCQLMEINVRLWSSQSGNVAQS